MIQHHILVERNYAYLEIRQSPSVDDFISAARLFARDPDFSGYLHRICDFSQANVSHITMDEFMKFVEFAVREVPLFRGTKIALVAPDESRSGIFHAFADQVQNGWVQVFYDPMEAVDWVQEKPATQKSRGPIS